MPYLVSGVGRPWFKMQQTYSLFPLGRPNYAVMRSPPLPVRPLAPGPSALRRAVYR